MKEFAEEVFKVMDTGGTAEVLILFEDSMYVHINMEKKDKFMDSELNPDKLEIILDTFIVSLEESLHNTALSILLPGYCVDLVDDMGDDENPYGLNLN